MPEYHELPDLPEPPANFPSPNDNDDRNGGAGGGGGHLKNNGANCNQQSGKTGPPENDADDLDFDDLTRRFEELKKKR